MNFQIVKAALQKTLTEQANGAFLTVGSPRRTTSADDLQVLPVVQTYFHQIEFDKGRGTDRGSKRADVTYKVSLLVAAPAQGDIATLSQTPTFGEVVQSIQNIIPANDLADAAFDSLVAAVWNILANPLNHQFGLSDGTFGNLWIGNVQKANPVQQGEAVVIAGSMDIALTVNEIPPTVTPIVGVAGDTKLKPTTDQTADPTTVGFNLATIIDPKFTTSDNGVQVGI